MRERFRVDRRGACPLPRNAARSTSCRLAEISGYRSLSVVRNSLSLGLRAKWVLIPRIPVSNRLVSQFAR